MDNGIIGYWQKHCYVCCEDCKSKYYEKIMENSKALLNFNVSA